METHIKKPTQCTAKSKRSGNRCKRAPSKEMTVCAMHGGKTPKGFQSPHYKHGRHSRYLNHLPPSERARFAENADTLKIPSIQDEINLTQIHLQELLETLPDSTLFENWTKIRAVVKNLQTAVADPPGDNEQPSSPSPAEYFEQLDKLFRHTESSIKTWDRIHPLIDRLRCLQETHNKLRVSALAEAEKLWQLVPVAVFREFATECVKQFDLSPGDIKITQIDGVAAAYNILPKVIREPISFLQPTDKAG